MRTVALVVSVLGFAGSAAAQLGELRVEVYEPVPGSELRLDRFERELLVEGGASIFGGVRKLDLFLVMDSSKSLLRTDPRDHRVQGAVELVESLARKSDIHVGVVDFDRKAKLLEPLTPDRDAVIGKLRKLDREGSTNLAAGILTALEGFEAAQRDGSSRVILLFTDGKSNGDKARAAAGEARAAGVAVHTVLLGSDNEGELLLYNVAVETGGSFIHVIDPAELPSAFLNLRTTGVERVTLRANGGEPIPTQLSGGSFEARVPYQQGRNTLVATATSLDGRSKEQIVEFTVRSPLRVVIERPQNGAQIVEATAEQLVEGQVVTFEDLPEEYLAEHPNRGVQRVTLEVNDLPPFAAELSNGRFRGRVPLEEGENHIVATATTAEGLKATAAVTLTVRPPGCGELEVKAERDGRPALSISDRAVEIVFDASNSMWGRIDTQSKISIAKRTVRELMDWMPDDLRLALRVYGHQHVREKKNCRDSQLLVGFGDDNRAHVQQSIAAFQPRGQTPLAYSLQQITRDFGEFEGERAVVLLTDGIESCGGDPVAAARDLQRHGRIPVHVIGFGLGGADLTSLQAIAAASGGSFLTAQNARELSDALQVAVGTSFHVYRENGVVASGTLGADQRFRLPPGSYLVRMQSSPPHEMPVSVQSEIGTTLTLTRGSAGLLRREKRWRAEYERCVATTESPAAPYRPN